MSAKPRVVVLGGGFAALESAFLMRMRMRDQVDLTLVSDSDSFVFRPNTIYIPFGADPQSLLVDLERPLRRRDVVFERGSGHRGRSRPAPGQPRRRAPARL